jgi:hypothetical protein
VNDFAVAIFRVADIPPTSSPAQPSPEERYIALVPGNPNTRLAPEWHTSDALFGLQKNLTHISSAILNWEEAEKQITKYCFYKVAHPRHKPSEEEQSGMDHARNEARRT